MNCKLIVLLIFIKIIFVILYFLLRDEKPNLKPNKIEIGSKVQWLSDGFEQFPEGKIVHNFIEFEDEEYALLIGEKAGVKTSELVLFK